MNTISIEARLEAKGIVESIQWDAIHCEDLQDTITLEGERRTSQLGRFTIENRGGISRWNVPEISCGGGSERLGRTRMLGRHDHPWDRVSSLH